MKFSTQKPKQHLPSCPPMNKRKPQERRSVQFTVHFTPKTKQNINMGFGFGAKLFLVLPILSLLTTDFAAAQPFRCNTTDFCHALLEYVPANATTISAVKALFTLKSSSSIFGANDLPLSTPLNFTIPAGQSLKIPIPCLCYNNSGVSYRLPIYTVKENDTLFSIANTVFLGFLDFQKFQEVNQIENADVITVGQRLWIPLPCSCELVNGERVVHYAVIVRKGSSVEAIAQTFGTDKETLLEANGIANDSQLIAGQPFDVPLKVCNTSVGSNSLDYPLLVSNGTYVLTANNCVKCKCDSANNWTLQCEPSQLNSSKWKMCPSMQCEGPESLYLGNSSSSNCNRTSCTYMGYTNQTILTNLAAESTCPASSASNNLSGIGSSWSIYFILVHLFLLCSL